jgi:hypothetical protein
MIIHQVKKLMVEKADIENINAKDALEGAHEDIN